MSLISEALRKAQLEALQQDREQRRFYMNHGGRPGQNAPAISRTSLAIVVLASLCVLSAGALLYVTLDRSNAAVPAAAAARPATLEPLAAPVPVTAAAAPAQVPRAEEPASVPHEKAERASARTSRSAAAVSAPPKTRSRTRPEAESVAVAPPERATQRRVERDGFREGETYGSPILGPLGTEVVLSGITALRGQHVAIINGNTVRAGTAVGPFVIEEIESRRVRLKYVDITFYVVQ